MSDAVTPDHPARLFRHFSQMCEGQSPLYSALSRGIASDPRTLALISAMEARRFTVNLLFGAVHSLLLAGAHHPLAGFYPSVGGGQPADEAYPAFADFCRRFEGEIREIVAAQQVQTNEVGRCGLLLPALALAWEHGDRMPLSLIDLGASAGLNLLFDRYRYEYGNGHHCGPESAARIRTELRGDLECPLPGAPPPVIARVGVDLAPADVSDADSMRWIESLIWPDQLHRIELFRNAVAIARADPPRLIAGDGLEVVPRLLEQTPPQSRPCVLHSHAVYQMDRPWRREFNSLLAELGHQRDLAHISLEWLGDDPGPQLHLTFCSGGERRTFHLADCDHHGRWMRWLAELPLMA